MPELAHLRIFILRYTNVLIIIIIFGPCLLSLNGRLSHTAEHLSVHWAYFLPSFNVRAKIARSRVITDCGRQSSGWSGRSQSSASLRRPALPMQASLHCKHLGVRSSCNGALSTENLGHISIRLFSLPMCGMLTYHPCDTNNRLACIGHVNKLYVGRVQLASDFGKRLRAAISCHLTQTSKESA